MYSILDWHALFKKLLVLGAGVFSKANLIKKEILYRFLVETTNFVILLFIWLHKEVPSFASADKSLTWGHSNKNWCARSRPPNVLNFYNVWFCTCFLPWPTTVTAKPKTSRQKQNTSRQHRKPHGKTKNLTAKTKYLTAKPKTSNLVLPWGFCFCLEVFGFAVTVVGHHSFCIKFEKNLPFVFQVTIYRMWAEAKSAFVSRFLYTSNISRWFPKM